MNKINLLPWREELRKRLNKIFLFELGKNVALSILVIIMVDNYFNHRIETNNTDVLYVNTELQKMSSQVAELQGLEKSKKQILERISIIQSLQQDRFSIVKLLDTLPRVLPEGVHLSLISRKTKFVAITEADAKQPNPAIGGASKGAAGPGDLGAGGRGGKGRRGGRGAESGAAEPPVATPAPAPPVAKGTAAAPKKGAATGAKKKGDPTAGMKEKYAITLEGVSANNSDIAVFLKNLQNIKDFDGVTLNEVGVEKGGAGLHFKIEFTQDIGAQG